MYAWVQQNPWFLFDAAFVTWLWGGRDAVAGTHRHIRGIQGLHRRTVLREHVGPSYWGGFSLRHDRRGGGASVKGIQPGADGMFVHVPRKATVS